MFAGIVDNGAGFSETYFADLGSPPPAIYLLRGADAFAEETRT